MPNKDLKNTYFTIPSEIIESLKQTLIKKGYDGNDVGYRKAQGFINKPQISYDEMRKLKNYFDTYYKDVKDAQYILNGGTRMRTWINNSLETATNAIKKPKEVKKNAGQENQFIQPHEKDRQNSNPDYIGMPDIVAGSKSKYISNNTAPPSNLFTKKENKEENKMVLREIREMIDRIKNFNQSLNEQQNPLVDEWTNDIVEYLQGYYGPSKDYSKLYKLIKEVVTMAISAISFNSFNDFLGQHNPKYWETNKADNYKNLWWGTLSYLLGYTDKIVKDEIDENFTTMVIAIMDNVIEGRQEEKF